MIRGCLSAGFNETKEITINYSCMILIGKWDYLLSDMHWIRHWFLKLSRGAERENTKWRVCCSGSFSWTFPADKRVKPYVTAGRHRGKSQGANVLMTRRWKHTNISGWKGGVIIGKTTGFDGFSSLEPTPVSMCCEQKQRLFQSGINTFSAASSKLCTDASPRLDVLDIILFPYVWTRVPS